MKKYLFLLFTTIYCLACQNTPTKSDAWEKFLKCQNKSCLIEAVAVKDAFLKNPQDILTQLQTTYEKGDDSGVSWLYLVRDSVLLNPKMGTIEERTKMQNDLIATAKPFEKDPKLHDEAKNVMDYLNLSAAEIKAGKIKEDEYCFQFNHQGEHAYCHLVVNESGEYHGYYNSFIEEKDGASGVLESKNSFFNDTLLMEWTYIQEGIVANESLMFIKKGDNLVNLVSEIFSEDGKMVLDHKEQLKTGNTLTSVDCEKIDKEYIQPIIEDEKEKWFSHPVPDYSEKDLKVIDKLQGNWQSLDDPKASIKIVNGYYTDIYVGEKATSSVRCIYYPTCPKDCNPIAKMSCLQVLDHDEICYAIVKADGKVLQLSQIGGTGNTNRYVKKK
jgi:hypothetical protein